jgi:hypothetical protein
MSRLHEERDHSPRKHHREEFGADVLYDDWSGQESDLGTMEGTNGGEGYESWQGREEEEETEGDIVPSPKAPISLNSGLEAHMLKVSLSESGPAGTDDVDTSEPVYELRENAYIPTLSNGSEPPSTPTLQASSSRSLEPPEPHYTPPTPPESVASSSDNIEDTHTKTSEFVPPVQIIVAPPIPPPSATSPTTPSTPRHRINRSMGPSTFEKVMSKTRPVFLPPKDKTEDNKHLADWEAMMKLSRAAGECRVPVRPLFHDDASSDSQLLPAVSNP